MKGVVEFYGNEWVIKNENEYYSIQEETDEFYYKSKVIGNIYENKELLNE